MLSLDNETDIEREERLLHETEIFYEDIYDIDFIKFYVNRICYNEEQQNL